MWIFISNRYALQNVKLNKAWPLQFYNVVNTQLTNSITPFSIYLVSIPTPSNSWQSFSNLSGVNLLRILGKQKHTTISIKFLEFVQILTWHVFLDFIHKSFIWNHKTIQMYAHFSHLWRKLDASFFSHANSIINYCLELKSNFISLSPPLNSKRKYFLMLSYSGNKLHWFWWQKPFITCFVTSHNWKE